MIKTVIQFILLSIWVVGCNLKREPILNIDTKALEKISDTTTHSSFIIRNDGNKMLLIEDVISSCACTILLLKKGDSILPNKSLVVPITFEKDSINERKLILITLKTNTVPKLRTIKIVI